ncbi:hypothetical protein [Streptomyces sp. M92]|uniref:hypothetical protein n=1 Tax=Streptomyces sp. M92 TaxID=2944250 RepID=UPI00234B6EDF|nr:hypothetical protein [Streptomyces sp. M92]WCN05306.1 hypothetical protein M6G08_26265 [Streptomyces sp. M92]
MEHTRAVPGLHASGKRLAGPADAVLDNCAPAGDALLPPPGEGSLGGVSTIVSTTLAQMVVAESVALLLAEGHVIPAYLSANVPGQLRTQRAAGGPLRGRPA